MTPNGVRFFFPTHLDLADILGRTDLHSDICLADFSGFHISRFLDFRIQGCRHSTAFFPENGKSRSSLKVIKVCLSRVNVATYWLVCRQDEGTHEKSTIPVHPPSQKPRATHCPNLFLWLNLSGLVAAREGSSWDTRVRLAAVPAAASGNLEVCDPKNGKPNYQNENPSSPKCLQGPY